MLANRGMNMQKSIPIRVRIFNHSDREFVTSLIARFSEFELPVWRTKDEVDNMNRISLQKAMEELEPGSVIFIAEDEFKERAGFIHVQTQID
jgi:hypothetical protein